MRSWNLHLPALLAVMFVLTVSACSTPRQETVPAELLTQAQIPGIPGARYIYNRQPDEVIAEARRTFALRTQQAALRGISREDMHLNSLALSGGGDQGAFGAGLLVGWTEAGTRPTFDVVTGISTGALIAPFAFLGPDHDEALKAAYTALRPEMVYRQKGLAQAYFSDGAVDTTPFARLVEQFATQEMLMAIAEEYKKGRLLLIGTTNLDARAKVAWNMGRIAASGHPEALSLFRRVLIASAAVPGIAPPVMIDVEADGRAFQEMHVDGGTTTQVFFSPESISARQLLGEKADASKRTLYVIRNGQIAPEVETIERRTLKIGIAALSSMIARQGVGDLYTIYLLSQRDGFDYNLAYIGEDFREPHPEEFHPPYMQALFDYAYEQARAGYTWEKIPPGFRAE